MKYLPILIQPTLTELNLLTNKLNGALNILIANFLKTNDCDLKKELNELKLESTFKRYMLKSIMQAHEQICPHLEKYRDNGSQHLFRPKNTKDVTTAVVLRPIKLGMSKIG